MPFNTDTMKPPLHEQITEIQRKIQLLEGDRTAYYESSQSAIKTNRETIRQLRQDNKKMYRDVAGVNAGDEHIIQEAFKNRGVEKDAYRNMSVKEALTALEQRVLLKVKRLNALKHTTQTWKHRLEELKMECQRMKPKAGSGMQPADAHSQKREEEAMRLRSLENSLEKAQFKCIEAENIMTSYLEFRSHLQEESLTFQGQLDNLEDEILKHREELRALQVMNEKAQLSKESAKAELQQQEELLYKERKERERIIASYRKKIQEVQEAKAQAEKVDRRAQRATMQPDELSSEAQRSTTRMTGEEEKTMSSFEEAFRRIKAATGVTNIQEIAERFDSQKETHQRLERLKEENEAVLLELKEQKEQLNQQFEDMKYSGEAKFSSKQQMLEECEHQLEAQQQRSDAAKERLDWQVKTLSTVRAGVEHLTDKLQNISLSEGPVAVESADSQDFVLELMTQCQLKLGLLQEELQGKDLSVIMKEMDEEEFFVRIEGKLPAYNTRVKLPDDQLVDLFNDEDESEEDEADIMSRDALKRQSQLIIDSKSKKKPWKKRKDKF